MSVPPVAKLNELIIARTGNLADYDEMKSDVGTHKNTFWIRVSCCIVKNGPILAAEGKGASKKEARSNAAVNFMRKHLHEELPKPFPLLGTNSNYLDNITDANIHSNLNSLCTKCKFNQPVFKEGETTGPPHSRHFRFECRVSFSSAGKDFLTKGEGTSKCEAKSDAATKMLKSLLEEIEVEETFESQRWPSAMHGNEASCLNANPKSPQNSAPTVASGRSNSNSSLSSMLSSKDIFVIQIPVAQGIANTSSITAGVIIHPAKVDKVAENSNDSASSMNLIDLNDDSESKLEINKAKSKSMTNLANWFDDRERELEVLDEMHKKALAQAVSKIDSTLENIEKQLYDEILNTLENRRSQHCKTVTFLSNKFDVYINGDSKPKIFEGNTECKDTTIRIASLTKLLMDIKEHAIVNMKSERNSQQASSSNEFYFT